MSSGQQPRKFSEKIAIHQRKQREEEDEFLRVMQDVRSVIPGKEQNLRMPHLKGPGGAMMNSQGMSSYVMGQPHLRIHGSLPNVNVLSHPPLGIDCGDVSFGMSGTSNLVPGQHSPQHSVGAHGPVYASRGRSTFSQHHYHPYRGQSPQGSPTGGFSPVSRHPSEPRTSPEITANMPGPFGMMVSGQQLLQLPNDGSWRRTHSDPCVPTSLITLPSGTGSTGSNSPNNSFPTEISSNALPSQSRPVYIDSGSATFMSHYDPNYFMPASVVDATMNLCDSGQDIAGAKGSLPDLSSSMPGAFGVGQFVASNSYSRHPPAVPSVSLPHDSNAGNTNVFIPGQLTHATVSGHQQIQQRHSVQLPVHMPQYQQYNPLHMNSQMPSEVRSAPSSPADAVNESPTPSPSASLSHSPGSPYSQLQNQLQNMAVRDTSGVPTYWPQQHSPQYNSQQKMQQQQYHSYAQAQAAMGSGNPQSPNNGQIPDIILTGVDNIVSKAMDVSSGAMMNYDPNEILSSIDSIEPLDLATLQEFAASDGHDLGIDQATEDALRRERV